MTGARMQKEELKMCENADKVNGVIVEEVECDGESLWWCGEATAAARH